MPLRVDSRAWAKVLAHYGTPRRPRSFDEPLWIGPEPAWYRVELGVPPDWAYLLICTKDSCVRWWSEQGARPADVAVVSTGFPNDPRVTAVLRPLADRAAAATFVGDMDPHSIVQYVETMRALSTRKAPPLSYGGIDDTWLAAMDRAQKARTRPAHVQIPLSHEERTLLRDIQRAVDLEDLLGPRGAAMLRGGYKVELEGGTNPAIYPPSHRRWIFRHLRSLFRRTEREAPRRGRRSRAGQRTR